MTWPAPAEPHAFAAEVSGRWVVLDLRADRYFLVRPTGASPAADTPPLHGRPGLALDPVAATWSAKGALWPDGPPRLGPVLAALHCLGRVSRLIERRPFEAWAESVRRTPVARRRPLSPGRLLASYEAARPFHSRGRICRLDAPALCLLFRRYGHPARLVFGARLEPFAAHCWAELEGRVLNEPLEKVAPFRALLSV